MGVRNTIRSMWQSHLPIGVEQEPSKAPKERASLTSILQFLAALFAFLTGVVGFGWTKNNPTLTKLLFVLVGVALLLWLALPRIRTGVKRLIQKHRGEQFVCNEQAGFNDLLRRFNRFVSRDDSRSIIPILQSGISFNMEAIVRIPGVNGVNYIGRWLTCFERRLAFPVRGIVSFMTRCQEFTIIVDEFNREYVGKAQKELEAGKPIPDQYIHDLEQFREDFLAYLREFEQWADRLTNESRKLVNDEELVWTSLVRTFPRVKSFRRSSG